MKKLLALVLALVMTMGLATVAANAKYSDDADINYKEAVEVMSAIGVLEGADGKFSPDLKLTREQAAKIICYMLLGEKTAEKLAVSNAPFSDVAATRWSAPYIAYCAANKIVDGIGNGAFDPAGALTGLAFAKMLLTALKIEGEYTGSNWAINVATAFTKEKLDDGAEDVVLSSVISREEAAQFAFTAAKYNGTEKVYGVDENGDGVADKTFDDRTDALLYSQKAGNAYVGKVENTENSLLDEVFDVDSATGTDKFGRPATVYSCDDWDDDLTFADEAKYSFTASKAYTVTSDGEFSDALNKELNLTAASKKIVFNADTTLINDAADANGYTNLQKGDVVEVFMNGDSKTDVAKVVIARYDLVKVDDVKALTDKQIKSNAKSSDSKVVNATATVTLKDPAGNGYTVSDNYNTQIPGFDFAKGDWILVAKNAANKALDSKEAETVSGTINSTKGTKYGINGTYYEATADVTKDINTKGTWALNAAGQLAADVDVAEYTEDFVYIYSIKTNNTSTDGIGGSSYVAYGIASDGTKLSKTLETKDDNGKTYIKGGVGDAAYMLIGGGAGLLDGQPDLAAVELVMPYKLNKDGKMEVADSKLTAQAANNADDVSKSAASVGNGCYATNDTLFIYKYISNNALKIKTLTGYKNVNIDASATPYYAVTNSSKKAIYVFVDGEAKSATTSESVVYAVYDGGPVYTEVDDEDVYTYTFLTGDGDKTVAAKEQISANAPAQGDVFAYVVEDSAIEVKTTYVVAAHTTFISGSQLIVKDGNNNEITIDTSSVKLYTVTKSYESEADFNNGDIDTVEVDTGASFNKTAGEDGYEVYVCYDKAASDSDAKVVAVFAVATIVD